ncbi:AMP-binding protein [Salinibacterium hongtaonis]|uniref:O-succinylbenzoate--CoA ligase n=1 Tax=Homoserinimonas hongtaonis TaxID=2079791 RepID=A0A2U1T2A5_9MICO|nr:AMP-binding protein [Salinibacterium hongtaonis]AWB88263.1 o-succinylbenzoate--CoA ligase [Salinibacterium hongtaonis]PWB98012.1 o-succinylbenzoate--CoA ligase [Salinibacterium hongtaonis]
MIRRLRAVDGAHAATVHVALREALAGGDAIVPTAGAVGQKPVAQTLPDRVDKRVALVVQTSGSTGHSKAVALSSDALLAGAAASESALGGPGQWLLALPAHYIAGINVLTRSITAGTDPVIYDAPRFDPVEFALAAQRMDAALRFTSLVPTQLARLLAADQTLEVLRRFDRILVGGQATPQPLLARAIEAGLNVTRTYGSSETAGGCVYDGIALAGVGIEIVDGEVQLSGPVLAEGYLGDPERTESAFELRDGTRFYRTGDTGEIVDGVLRVTGRLDDVIVTGGLKVSLGAVERIVRSISGQTEAVVVSVEHDQWGEVPVVVTTVPIGLAAVRAAVAAEERPEARPHRVIVIDELPLLASRKPDRRAIRAIAEGSARS